MAAKMYVVAILAMAVAGATACTMTTTTTTVYPASMACYPDETIPLVNYKKCMYELNQAIGNMMYKSQSLFDYFIWYSSSPEGMVLYQSPYTQKMSTFINSAEYLEQTYQKCMNLLDIYKTSVSYMPSLSDDVPVTSILL